MTAATIDRERLVKLCGMLGSAHPGERANAAAAADRMVREAGATWREVILHALPAPDPDPVIGNDGDALDFCLACEPALTEWEVGFIRSLADRRRWAVTPFTEKQRSVLARLTAKCLRAARATA
jgi:hypothetical protein